MQLHILSFSCQAIHRHLPYQWLQFANWQSRNSLWQSSFQPTNHRFAEMAKAFYIISDFGTKTHHHLYVMRWYSVYLFATVWVQASHSSPERRVTYFKQSLAKRAVCTSPGNTSVTTIMPTPCTHLHQPVQPWDSDRLAGPGRRPWGSLSGWDWWLPIALSCHQP